MAIKKIQEIMSGRVQLESKIIDKAFNKRIISVEVRPKNIGRRVIDVDSVFARAYLEAKKKIPKDVDFMIYGSLKVTIYEEGTIETKINKTTTTYKSTELCKQFKQLTNISTT